MKLLFYGVAYPLAIAAAVYALCLNSDSQAAELAMSALPRSFEGAHLGMAQSALTAQARSLGKLVFEGRSSLIVHPKNPSLAQIDYRFHRGALREIGVTYKSHRIPGGYESLVNRLKDVYGPPQEETSEMLDPRPDVLYLRKTVWSDASTQVMVIETRRIQRGEEPWSDLVLTLTDRRLEESYREDQIRRQRQEVSRVPIPLPESEQMSKRKGKVWSYAIRGT